MADNLSVDFAAAPVNVSADWTADSLMFDFTNDAVAQQRYNNPAYKNTNYDVAGAWTYEDTRVTAMAYGGGTTTITVKPKAPGDYKDDNGNYYSSSQVVQTNYFNSCSRCSGWTYQKYHRYWLNKCGGPNHCGSGTLKKNRKQTYEGELTCGKCDMDYCGACGYEKISGSSRHLTRVYPVPDSEKQEIVSPHIEIVNGLNFNPSNAEVVELRFKMNGCVAPNGVSVRLYYRANGETTWDPYYFTETLPASTASSNSYVTVSIPTGRGFKDFTSVNSLRLMFYGVGAAGDARITLDYLYIGRQSDGSLMFDFSNDNAVLSRYASFPYGGRNYAQASSWGSDSVAISNLSVNTAESKLVLQLPENGVSPAIRTWQENTAAANLRYDASAAEILAEIYNFSIRGILLPRLIKYNIFDNGIFVK